MTDALILDTCAIIWGAGGQSISEQATKAINAAEANNDEIYFSPISAWEIGLLVKRGRLHIAGRPSRWFQSATVKKGLKACELTTEVLIESSFLPGKLHDDPADRIIIASAREFGLRIVTRDRKILAYADLGEVKALEC